MLPIKYRSGVVFARRCLLGALLGIGGVTGTACSDAFPNGDYWNLAAVYNLVNTLGVSATSPAESATEVRWNQDIAVIFNRTMDPTSITVQSANGTCSGTIQLSTDDFATCLGGVVGSSATNETFVFNPTNNLTPATTYKIKVTTAAKDSRGESLPQAYVTANGFTAAVQPAPSTVTPTNGAVDVAVNSRIQVTFNKVMEPLTLIVGPSNGTCFNRTVLLSSDAFSTCLGGTLTTSDNITFTLTPSATLTPGTTYQVRLGSTIADSGFNTLGTAATASFTAYRPPANAGGPVMQMWLEASTSVFIDAGTTAATNGDTVQQWNDLSGNNNHASQGSAGLRARHVQGTLNGHASMRFDGTNDFFDLTAVTVSPTATPFTIFMVYRVSVLQTHVLVSQLDGIGTGRNILIDDNACGINHRLGSILGGFKTCSNTNLAVNTWNIAAMTSDMTNINFFLNGTAEGSGTPTIENATGNWRLGANKVGSGPLDGDIAEVIFYNNVLAATQRQRVECYFANKYGLTITGHTCN